MELYVYKITHKLTGACYIGLTNDVERRWKQHINDKTDSLIHRAIKLLGKDAFTFEILESGLPNYKAAAAREIFYIEYFNSITPFGYNRSPGGETPEGNYYNQIKGYKKPKTAIEQQILNNRKALRKSQKEAREKIKKLRKKLK